MALAGPLDRSVIFTLLLEYMPGFGQMDTNEGAALITEATEAWQASDDTDMAKFVKEWISRHEDGRDGGPRICEVLMHEVLLEDFREWLADRNLMLQRTPFLDEDPNLPVYNVAPKTMPIQRKD